ncbi:MAG: hypothetical protein QM791_12235 [Ferruginibacter sp.]
MKRFLLSLIICGIFTKCYKDNDYMPVNVNAGEVIVSLTALPDNIPADGQSFTYIIAELPLNAIDSKSNVVFTTTKGSFDNNTKTITQLATLINDNGVNRRIAKVKLTGTVQIDTAEVFAVTGNVTKSIKVIFSNLAYDNFLTVTADAPSVPADGASSTFINVEQPLNIPAEYSTVTFTTTNGTFDNGTKTITKSTSTILLNGTYKRLAQVRLTAGKIEETVVVEVAIKGTLKTVPVNFEKAYPEDVKIVIATPYITSGIENSLQITTNLIRQIGIPTIGNEASLRVVDADNAERGGFINYSNKSDASGSIVNKFTLGTDSYRGVLRIIAESKDASGKQLSHIVTINVK